MGENRKSISFSQTDIDAINQTIATLAEKLQPVFLGLDIEDRKYGVKVSENSLSFVERSIQYAELNREFLPPTIVLGEMKQSFTAFQVLSGFLRPLQQITKNLDDLAARCGGEAIIASLGYYNSVRQAVKMSVPHASTIYEDLSQRFKTQKPRRFKTETVK